MFIENADFEVSHPRCVYWERRLWGESSTLCLLRTQTLRWVIHVVFIENADFEVSHPRCVYWELRLLLVRCVCVQESEMFRTNFSVFFLWEGISVFHAKGKTYTENVLEPLHKSRMIKFSHGCAWYCGYTGLNFLDVTLVAPVILKVASGCLVDSCLRVLEWSVDEEEETGESSKLQNVVTLHRILLGRTYWRWRVGQSM